WLRFGYCLVLAAAVLLLARPTSTRAQFHAGGHMPIAPPVNHFVNLTFSGLPRFVFVPPPILPFGFSGIAGFGGGIAGFGGLRGGFGGGIGGFGGGLAGI